MNIPKITKLTKKKFEKILRTGKMDKIKILIYKDCMFFLYPGVYEPSDESFFLAENMIVKKNDKVLDIGTGIGLLALLAAKKAKTVIGTDIDKISIKCAKINRIINKKLNVSFAKANYFPNNQQKFDLIVFNPPDFPSIIQKSHRGDYVEKFVDGGKDGREHLDQVIKKAHLYLNKNGRIQLVQSYVSNIEKTVKLLEKNGLKVKITATKIEPFGRTGRERIDYFKKLGIKIIYHSDIPMEKLCIVTAYKNKI